MTLYILCVPKIPVTCSHVSDTILYNIWHVSDTIHTVPDVM